MESTPPEKATTALRRARTTSRALSFFSSLTRRAASSTRSKANSRGPVGIRAVAPYTLFEADGKGVGGIAQARAAAEAEDFRDAAAARRVPC